MNIATASAEDLVEGEWAAGVLTHIIITPDTGAIAGTNASRGIEMAREADFDLELVHDTAGLCGGGEPPVVTAVDDADFGLDLDPALAGTYTVQVTGGLTTPPEVEISIARTVTTVE